jgi:hypothetical protein
MSRSTEANASRNSLSTSVTCEHANVALFSTCLQLIGDGGKYQGNPTGATWIPPGPQHLRTRGGTPGSTDADTTHHPIPEQTPSVIARPGLALVVSTLTAPSDAPSAPSASRADSAGAGVPRGTDATKGKYGVVTRRTEGQRTIGANEVQLQSPQHHFLGSEQEQEKRKWGKPMDNTILRGHR